MPEQSKWKITWPTDRPTFLWFASILVAVAGVILGALGGGLANTAAVNVPQDPITSGSKTRLLQSTPAEAYFQFDYPPYPERFIFKLSDPETIQEARDILNGEQPSRHVMGTIIKEPAGYNPPWSYHLDPESVVFFDSALEVCDATIQHVEENLEEACDSFLPGCVWCPWGSRLLAEVTALPGPTPTATTTNTPTPTATFTVPPTATPTVTAQPTVTPPLVRIFLPLVHRNLIFWDP